MLDGVGAVMVRRRVGQVVAGQSRRWKRDRGSEQGEDEEGDEHGTEFHRTGRLRVRYWLRSSV
ncbi:hypothetical protein [Haladaptatus sp. W1]|uniref:hypothetical protein n=1 Tax=Haladaptatus sp. W1 TaxID=1897478 RepID=UPI0020C74AD0|nr:hypothetical protein [Haladaptatus sp. W1]